MKEAWRTVLGWLGLVTTAECFEILLQRSNSQVVLRQLELERLGDQHAKAILTERHAFDVRHKELSDQRSKDLEIARNRHLHELEQAKQSAQRIIDNCSCISFDYGSYRDRQYVVSVSFGEGLIGGLGHREDMRMIAEYVGRKVEAEIASSRFVKSAQQSEIDRRRRAIENSAFER